MPIRAVVSPKFTYSQGTQLIQFVRGVADDNAFKNGMFKFQGYTEDQLKLMIFFPDIKFPEFGQGHSARKSNRITVTSVRVKLQFQMNHALLYQRYLQGAETLPDFSGDQSIPLNPGMFMKFRLFLIQVDDDIPITAAKLYNWFLATHCLYRNVSVSESIKGPDADSVTPVPGPTSIHSNVLRTTTPWTGKFNVLADRKFVLSARRPTFDVDMTIPLRKEYVFDEQYDENSVLLYPKLYLVIFPPLSFEVDVDPWSAYAFKNVGTSSTKEVTAFRVYHWSKLNFVDL